jgi:hypothetical protein
MKTIIPVLNVSTYIITNITAHPTGLTVMLVTMSVSTRIAALILYILINDSRQIKCFFLVYMEPNYEVYLFHRERERAHTHTNAHTYYCQIINCICIHQDYN